MRGQRRTYRPPRQPPTLPFKRDVDAVDVHMLISAFCNLRIANSHTFGAIFGRDLTDKRQRKHYRQMLAMSSWPI